MRAVTPAGRPLAAAGRAAPLLATGAEVLIEDAPDDYFWGRGADGTGANNLGKILMALRSLLRSTR